MKNFKLLLIQIVTTVGVSLWLTPSLAAPKSQTLKGVTLQHCVSEINSCLHIASPGADFSLIKAIYILENVEYFFEVNNKVMPAKKAERAVLDFDNNQVTFLSIRDQQIIEIQYSLRDFKKAIYGFRK